MPVLHILLTGFYAPGSGFLGRSITLLLLWLILGAALFQPKSALADPDTRLIIAEKALPHAHAHNDYQHSFPLVQALSCGYTSIEADVHLVDSLLYLGHYFPKINQKNLLQKVYLEPLNNLMARQNGKVYPNYEGVFLLMIDVKTDSLTTFYALKNLIEQYPFLHHNPYFQIFISGNRAQYAITNDKELLVGLDGRLTDLDQEDLSENMPVISDNYKRFFSWKGKGKMPAKEQSRLHFFVSEAHKRGKKLRFWNIPDQPRVWGVLLEAGVDLISTDKLEDLKLFFIDHGQHVPA